MTKQKKKKLDEILQYQMDMITIWMVDFEDKNGFEPDDYDFDIFASGFSTGLRYSATVAELNGYGVDYHAKGGNCEEKN